MLHWEEALLISSSDTFDTETHQSDKLKLLLEEAISASTKKAYQSDLRHFRSNGGVIPSSPEVVAEYVARFAGIHKPATIARRLVSIGKAHRLSGFENPVASDIVKLSLRGLRRSEGSRQREAKPLLKEDLFAILESIDLSVKGRRDIALLLLCFAGGFRRSEVVGLNVQDIERVRQGIVVHLARSKTDQEGRGRKIAIPCGSGAWCPVRALEAWISISRIEVGPLFRVINRHSQISTKRLSGQAVSLIVKTRAHNASLDGNNFSGHSLRAGFATSAARAGASSLAIRKQTGHRTDSMLNRYIRDADLFARNATAAVL
jgi:integrase